MDVTKGCKRKGRPRPDPLVGHPGWLPLAPNTVEDRHKAMYLTALIKILLKFYFKMSVFNDIPRDLEQMLYRAFFCWCLFWRIQISRVSWAPIPEGYGKM